MLFQVIDNQFLVVKKTWPNIFILTVGAGLNILLDYLLIPILGIEGAAIATLSGYLVSLVICVIVLYCMKLITVRWQFYAAVGVTSAYILIWRLLTIDIVWLNVVLAVVFGAILVLLYLKDIRGLIRGIRNKGKDEVRDAPSAEEPADTETEKVGEIEADTVAENIESCGGAQGGS